MNRKLWFALTLALACGDDGSGSQEGDSGDGSTSGQEGSDTMALTMTGTMTVGMTAAEDDSTSGAETGVDPTGTDPDSTTGDPPDDDSTGEPGDDTRVVHDDCGTGYCRSCSDAPPDPMSACLPPPDGGNTRVTGTVRDLATLDPVPNAQVRIASALSAATNPNGARSMIDLVSDPEGQVSGTSGFPIAAQIGIVALVEAGGDTFLTTIPIASPQPDMTYPPGNVVHDLWSVDSDTLVRWSNTLRATVPGGFLPLGEEGGAAIVVRDLSTGDPIAGATAGSIDGGSGAFIAYPSADGMALGDATSESGVILIVAPGLAESFRVNVGGEPVAQVSAFDANGTFGVVGVNVE